ncbi:MAG: hypothetical protein R3E97_13840 [Candidatus Eisenbacteria bacterium]
MPRGLLLWVSLIVFAISACGGDSTSPPPGPEYVLPATPDELVSTFAHAYSYLQLATIDSLIAPGFVFEFAAIDQDSFQIGATWGRDDELRSMERFFGGEEGVWPTGGTRPPLDTEFPLNPQLRPVDGSEWVESEPGHFVRPYEIAMIVNYIEGIDVVSGTQTFEVTDVSMTGGPDGQSASGYAIVGWHDSGVAGLAVVAELHVASWGYVKASFRGPAPVR